MQNQEYSQESGEGNIFLQVNRFEVQENAVFVDFSQEEVLKNIQNYKNLNFYHRVSLSKNIATIREVCNENPLFNTFLLELASDCDDIKHELIDYLRLNSTKITPQTNVQRVYIQPLVKLINSSHLEIREQSCVLLTQITHQLTGKERKDVLRLALQLQKSEDEQSRIISIQLISKMTPDMTTDEAELFFKDDFIVMYKQSSLRLKREIIHSTPFLAKNVGKQFLNKQVIDNFFVQKCKEAIWGIRKACIEIMPQIVVLTDSRKQQIANILINLTKDSSKIVKIAAYKTIPEFLANYNSPNVPQKLVNMYIHLIDSEANELVYKNEEIAAKVAFYFPGVMFTLGSGKWQIMKKLFNRLLTYTKNNDVKMPIASSLHEISRIIGPQLSKEYMFRALDLILKDNSDALKLAAISHISQFVELFQKTTRENLIDIFLELQKDPKKWRIRFQIAHQLNILSRIYQTETVFKYIFPISLKLCNDGVYEVRFQAAKQMFNVVDNMKQLPDFQLMAVQSLKGYALSEKYIQRQTFAWMIKNIYKLKLFKENLLQLLKDLAKDKVILVRIALAISISYIIKEDPENQGMFRQIVEIMQEDQQDIRQYFE